MTVIMPCYILSESLIELTRNAVESLGGVNLVIIDNASPMGGGYLRSVANLYIRNLDNLGYAKAVNQGLKLVKDPYIAIANNDIRVSPNWQEIAFEVLEDVKVYSCHFRMTDYNVPFEYGDKVIKTGKERWCASSFFVIRSNHPQLYDEKFFNSYDDWDYWFRIRNSRYLTAYTDKACYQHLHSTTQELIPERNQNDKKNREYFKEKWGEYPEVLFEKEFPEQIKQDYFGGFSL